MYADVQLKRTNRQKWKNRNKTNQAYLNKEQILSNFIYMYEMYVNVCVWAWAWVWVCRMCICVRYMFCTLSVEFVSWTYEECLFCRRQTMALYLYSKQTPSTWSLSLRQSSLSLSLFFLIVFICRHLRTQTNSFSHTQMHARATHSFTHCVRFVIPSFPFVLYIPLLTIW